MKGFYVNMNKKLLVIIISVFMLLSMAACGDSSEDATEGANTIDVTLEAEVANDSATPQFRITSNLPDETELMLTLEQGDYSAQTKVYLSSGEAISEVFSNNGEALSGNYVLRVTMPVANTQADSVKEIIGEGAENLSGPLVKESEMEGFGKVVEAEFDFEF